MSCGVEWEDICGTKSGMEDCTSREKETRIMIISIFAIPMGRTTITLYRYIICTYIWETSASSKRKYEFIN
ncbi:hypothetical protein EYC84_011009 [Monilinia fructicola]|uniref:Uncharacterized protein n=1 Tax=Monilinia fructicola TaxID=38448 RepID=A0A5M9JCA0_MONFR|nr:hypothetical protein EYC84_011009 [Monilinia fructicola]